MTLAAGTKLGPYEIQSALGAGGMGEVYSARDPRLDRVVAIKVLPSALTSNEVVRQRLEREARAISKLSHPNICALHDIGKQDSIDFLVMEYLEGENLEQRIKRGPLPAEQTIRYSAQIAEALAHAHRLGVTHRDLKPSNVMLTKSGAKLMDFGLAKQSTALSEGLSDMTAEHSKLTGEGMLVGTFQYMAPEQLEGKEADQRTDIFALGEVMYEMATGKPAFSGGSRASLIASILTTEPAPIAQSQPLTPPGFERVVRKCLAKDPDERWQSAADLASELKWMSGESSSTQFALPTHPVAAAPKIDWKLWGLTAMAVLAASALLFHFFSHPAGPAQARTRWIISPPEGTSFLATGDAPAPVSISPDGRRIAFVAGDSGKVQLYIQSLDALTANAVPGTNGASWPFWSPDSRSLGFFAHGQLKRLDGEGTTPIDLCEAKVPRGASWGTGGVIVFAPDTSSSVFRVSASGGQPVSVTTLDPAQHDSHRWPFFLPDGKHFLYYAAGHDDISHSRDSLYVGSVDGGASKFLMHSHANAAYANGNLLFLNDHALMAQAFDLGRLALTGEPVVVQDGVEVHRTWWMSVFSASQNGMLVFAPAVQPDNNLIWMDTNGKKLGTVGDAGRYASVHLSPDDEQVVVERDRPHHDLWIHDLRRNLATQFTFGPTAGLPVWSNDGSKIAFSSERPGGLDLHVKSVNGGQDEEVLLAANGYAYPMQWSPDGSVLLYYIDDGNEHNAELRVMPMRGDHTPRVLLKAPFYISDGSFSPDMRWIVYSSRQSGTQKVFATPYPGPGPRIQISPAYGGSPVWQKDGHAILYEGDNSTIQVTEVDESGSHLIPGKTREISQVLEVPVGKGFPFDVAKDGRILLISRGNDNRSQLVVVSNWNVALK